jgi:hypothetical protein
MSASRTDVHDATNSVRLCDTYELENGITAGADTGGVLSSGRRIEPPRSRCRPRNVAAGSLEWLGG